MSFSIVVLSVVVFVQLCLCAYLVWRIYRQGERHADDIDVLALQHSAELASIRVKLRKYQAIAASCRVDELESIRNNLSHAMNESRNLTEEGQATLGEHVMTREIQATQERLTEIAAEQRDRFADLNS